MVLVAQLRDTRIQLADALAHRRQLAAELGQPRAIVGGIALQRDHAGPIDEPFLHELLVHLQFARRELSRVVGGVDARLQCGGLCLPLAHLFMQRRNLIVQ